MEGGRKSRSHDLIAKRLGEANKCGHAIASTLRGKKGLIEHYELFRFPIQQWQLLRRIKSSSDGKNSSTISSDIDNNNNNQQPVAAALVKVGNQLDGPIGKVHGGIIALLFDDIMGFAVVPLLFPCVTRDLAVVYKVPQPHDTFVVVRVYIDDAKTAEYETEQQAVGPRKKRIFLRATSSSLPTGSTLETAAFTPESDGDVIYSTATITMVQVSTGPPSSRGDAMKPISKLWSDRQYVVSCAMNSK